VNAKIYRVQTAWLLVFVAAIFLSTTTSSHAARSATLTWDANSEPDLAGYAVYCSIEQSGSRDDYDLIQDVPLQDLVDSENPEVVVTELTPNSRYYFVVTAYNEEGLESGYSNEVCVEVSDSSVTDCTPKAVSTSSSGGGGGGGGCFISLAAFESKVSLISGGIVHRSSSPTLRLGVKPAALNP
jgi:hypothetical protein